MTQKLLWLIGVVHGKMIEKVIITKVARIVSVMFLRKIKKPISMLEVFSLVFFFYSSVFFFFSFVILTIIRTRKRQRAHFNNASNVNRTITMTSWRNRDIITYLIFPKLYNLELSRIYSFHFVFQTCKITFVSLRYFYSHKTRFSLWWCWLIWISRYAFSNVLKKIFVLRTSISYIVWFNVPQKTQKYAVIYCNTWKVLILIMHSE